MRQRRALINMSVARDVQETKREDDGHSDLSGRVHMQLPNNCLREQQDEDVDGQVEVCARDVEGPLVDALARDPRLPEGIDGNARHCLGDCAREVEEHVENNHGPDAPEEIVAGAIRDEEMHWRKEALAQMFCKRTIVLAGRETYSIPTG
jgi:hypothetical protein